MPVCLAEPDLAILCCVRSGTSVICWIWWAEDPACHRAKTPERWGVLYFWGAPGGGGVEGLCLTVLFLQGLPPGIVVICMWSGGRK